jgi:ketosteroid isomerase-like protein
MGPFALARTAILALVSCSLVAACSGDPTTITRAPGRAAFNVSGEGDEASSQAQLDLVPLRELLLAADRSWAAAGSETNLVEALAAPMAPDGIFLAPGTVFLRGPVAVRDYLNSNPANKTAKWRTTVLRVDVSSDGQHGYSYGYSEAQLATGAILPGKYLAYWALQTNGTWKMAAYKRVTRAAGAVSLTPPPGFETPTTNRRRYYPNTEPATELQKLFAVDVAFSDASQLSEADAFATFAAPDGAQTGGGNAASWIFGPDAIRAAHQTTPSGFTWAPTLGAVATSGDLGFTIGYIYSGTTAISKYFSVWQKQPNGLWRYVAD